MVLLQRENQNTNNVLNLIMERWDKFFSHFRQSFSGEGGGVLFQHATAHLPMSCVLVTTRNEKWEMKNKKGE